MAIQALLLKIAVDVTLECGENMANRKSRYCFLGRVRHGVEWKVSPCSALNASSTGSPTSFISWLLVTWCWCTVAAACVFTPVSYSRENSSCVKALEMIMYYNNVCLHLYKMIYTAINELSYRMCFECYNHFTSMIKCSTLDVLFPIIGMHHNSSDCLFLCLCSHPDLS